DKKDSKDDKKEDKPAAAKYTTRTVVLADGTYGTENVYEGGAPEDTQEEQKAESKKSSPLRTLLLGGDFLLSAMLGVSLTKLCMKASLPAATTNEVLLLIVNLYKLVRQHTCGGEKTDSAVRLTQCIRALLVEGGNALEASHSCAAALLKAEWASNHGRSQLTKVLELASQNAEWALGQEAEVEEKSVGPDECIVFRQLRERKGGGAVDSIDDDDDFGAARGKSVAGQAAADGALFAERLAKVQQMTGLADPVYVEAFLQVHSFDLVLELLIVNRTQDTLQNVAVELSTQGDLKLVDRPPVPAPCVVAAASASGVAQVGQQIAAMEAQPLAQHQHIADLLATVQQLQTQQRQQQQQAQPAAPVMRIAQRFEGVLDAKIIGKVKQFDGTRGGWSTWGFHWRAYMVANDQRYREFFDKLDEKNLEHLDDAKNATMSVDGVDWEDLSTQLYYMLVLAMPEDSAGETIMRNVLHSEGGQAWVRLKADFAPNEPGNVVARVRQLMSTQCPTNAGAANEIEKLGLEISKCEKAAGEQVSDNIKEGILLGALQNESGLQKHVFRNLRNLATYLEVKDEALSALKAQRSFGGDPMEINALKGESKGQGKGKGDKDTDKGKNKFEPKAKDNPNHPGKWCSHCEKPNHAKDGCRKFKRETEAKAEAKKKAKDEKKQRRATAAALAAAGAQGPHGAHHSQDQITNPSSQTLTPNTVYAMTQLTGPSSSGATPTANTLPTMPLGMRGANGLFADQDTIQPKYIFALSVEMSKQRSRSAEHDKGYELANSRTSKLQAIDGTQVQHYGRTGARHKTGRDVIQISAEAADVEFPVLSSDAITKQGKSVIHPPLGDWIVDSPISPPTAARSIKLTKDRGTCYLEYDDAGQRGHRQTREYCEEVGDEQLGEQLCIGATRKTLPAQVPDAQDRQQLPTALGPDPSDNVTLKAKELSRPGQPSAEERRAHVAHHLPFRSWCSECVMGRGKDAPHEMSSEQKKEGEYPVVEMGFFFAATDEIARKHPMINGYVVKVVDFWKLEQKERGEMPAILNVADCRSNASATLFGSKQMGDCKAHYVAKLVDSWGHATVILLTDGENAIVAVAEQVKQLRSHSTTKLGCKLELTDSILAFLANTVGWYIARSQPRSRGGSSYKYLVGREYAGEVAESEFDGQRLVVDLQRGLLKVRAVRRMPEEFRWNAELVKQIDRVKSTIRKSMYITENMLNTYGPTDNCPKCSYGKGQHSDQCRQRFETIAQERLEAKLLEETKGGPVQEAAEPNKRQRIGALVKAPEVVVLAGFSVCELAVCEEDDDQGEGPPWDMIPKAAERRDGLCEGHVGRCAYRRDHDGECACRRCLIGAAKKLNPDAEVVASLCALWSRRLTAEQCDWSQEPELAAKIHYDYYTGEPLDEVKYQKGKADELQAMAEYGVYRKIRIADCVPGGKHVGGIPIAHEKAGGVRWRCVATEVAHQHREDNRQGTPPLAMIRSILSLAASRPDKDGGHRRCIRIWDVRKAFFNSDLHEKIYVHPGSELCERGCCWELLKALCGTRLASQLWGENLDEVLSTDYEITSSPPLGPGHPGVARYLKRSCVHADQLPETLLPGFFWHADPKHVSEIIKFGSKEGAKMVDAPGTRAIGAQLRNALGPMPTAEWRKTASAGGLTLYLAADRPDIMFASKTTRQDVSKPSYQMNARLMRLARYSEGHQVLVWCYELQELPKILRADGDADWAAPTSVARKSTSGGFVKEDTRKMVADILTEYVDKDSMATHLHELNLRMARAPMIVATLAMNSGVARAEDQCVTSLEIEKQTLEQSEPFPWLLLSLAVVLCSVAYLVGWHMGRRKAVARTVEEGPRVAMVGRNWTPHGGLSELKVHPNLDDKKQITREVHRLYGAYTVDELRELLGRRGLVLKRGYTKKEELIENARDTSPTEMHILTQLTMELKDHGIDVKWRARMLASGDDINNMITTTTEVVDRLRELLR
ncbi:unnamed protein product, partial [Prorocentrum cordatum]